MGGALGLRRTAPSSRALGAGVGGLPLPWGALLWWPEDTGLPGKHADPPTPTVMWAIQLRGLEPHAN